MDTKKRKEKKRRVNNRKAKKKRIMDEARQEAITRSKNWWFCENIVSQKGKVGLLKMDFPRAFILIRDSDKLLFYEDFKNETAEVNFFNPSERAEADIEEILLDAWNFLALQEEEEEKEFLDDIKSLKEKDKEDYEQNNN